MQKLLIGSSCVLVYSERYDASELGNRDQSAANGSTEAGPKLTCSSNSQKKARHRLAQGPSQELGW